MSVITTTSSFQHVGREIRCALCQGFLLPPYIEYMSKNTLYICNECVNHYGQGLIADIVQTKAINDLRRLYPGYTLERKTLSDVARQHQLEKQ